MTGRPDDARGRFTVWLGVSLGIVLGGVATYPLARDIAILENAYAWRVQEWPGAARLLVLPVLLLVGGTSLAGLLGGCAAVLTMRLNR